MSEPIDFYQIDAELAGCEDTGWHLEFPDAVDVVISTEYWPDWQPLKVSVRCDGEPWMDRELVRGEQTSNSDRCKAHRVTLEVQARHKLVLRTYAPDGTIAATQWFRHLDDRRDRRT